MKKNRITGNLYCNNTKLRGSGKLNCADLFAGAGGFSLAAFNVGINVRAAIELDAHACKTYKANLVSKGGPKLYQENIFDLKPKKFAAEAFGVDHPCDIVLGGPPCQGFSTHRIKNAGVNDPRNELILRYFEYVSALKPRAFLMENVPGMLWPRHKAYLDAFYSEARRSHYKVFEPIILDARDYGVPQRRKRVFILGIRIGEKLDLTWPPPPSFGDEKAIEKNNKLMSWRNAADVFTRPINKEDINSIHMNHNAELIDIFRSTPPNGGSRHESKRVLPCHENYAGHKDVYGRIDPSKPGPTMTTACINPSKGRFLHPTEHHGITARHAARFQTFPDEYSFHGGFMSSGKQIGNAVPILLGEALLRELANALLKKDKRSE